MLVNGKGFFDVVGELPTATLGTTESEGHTTLGDLNCTFSLATVEFVAEETELLPLEENNLASGPSKSDLPTEILLDDAPEPSEIN